MAASRLTPNYLLPVFNPSDKPSWLGDWNTTMAKLDAALVEFQAEIDRLTAQLNTQSRRIDALAAATGHTNI